jgi:beta-glucosidase
VKELGPYRFTLTASSEAGELAQIPVTVFIMGTASGTFTWNGTGGKAVSFSGESYFFNRFTTIRLYFALGGLDLVGMHIERIKQ